MLLAGTSALLNVEVPAIPVKNQETPCEVWQPTEQEELDWFKLGFTTQTQLSVICSSRDPGLHLFAQAAGPPLLRVNLPLAPSL